jgi:hypothetical protein
MGTSAPYTVVMRKTFILTFFQHLHMDPLLSLSSTGLPIPMRLDSNPLTSAGTAEELRTPLHWGKSGLQLASGRVLKDQLQQPDIVLSLRT